MLIVRQNSLDDIHGRSQRLSYYRSECAGINRAGAAHLRRLARIEAGAEVFVGRPVPEVFKALFGEIAKRVAIWSRDHAAGHRRALVADIRALPGPVTALSSGRAGGVLARAGARKTQINPKLCGQFACLAKVALD